MAGPSGKFGLDRFGLDPYGGALPNFEVAGAQTLSHTVVRVTFTDLIDFTYGPMLTPANYTISPTVTVYAVQAESAQSVLLVTDALVSPVYSVTVGDGRSFHTTNLDPFHNSALFAGFGSAPTFFAVAVSEIRVRAVFEVAMQNDATLSDPASYVVTDVDGDPATVVLSATPEQATSPTSVVLVLATPIEQGKPYVLTISLAIKTQGGASSIVPNTSLFTWNGRSGQVSIPVSFFSGEVQNGLYGLHNGLVFFSPSLLTAAPNSIIQVDQVDVCTKAYDEYHPPQAIDPLPLFTWSALGPQTTLGQAGVSLWAPFPRLFEARFELTLDPQWVSLGSGSGASISAILTSTVTITGLQNVTLSDVGQYIRISGASAPWNNGTFLITSFVSATSVRYINTNITNITDPPIIPILGFPADANNPNIYWDIGNLLPDFVDHVPPPEDGPCSVMFQQPFDPSYVSLLNDTAWYLFDNTGTTVPPTFITANNLAPIPSGPTTILVLNAPMRGDSVLDAPYQLTVGVASAIVADSAASGTPT